MAIAFFYAVATGAGGIAGPVIYGVLVGTKDPTMLAWGFVGAAVLMIAAGVIEAIIGVPAERTSLEDVAEPLSAEDDGKPARDGRGTAGDGRRPEQAARGRRGFWSSYPAYTGISADRGRSLERQAELIEEALVDRGPQDRRSLARGLHARLWGPGCFRAGLGHALAQGRVRREGRLYLADGSPGPAP